MEESGFVWGGDLAAWLSHGASFAKHPASRNRESAWIWAEFVIGLVGVPGIRIERN